MKEQLNTLDICHENDAFRCVVDKPLVIVTIKASAFEGFSNLEKSEKILLMFDVAENDPSISGILIINEQQSFGDTLFTRFLNKTKSNNYEEYEKEINSSEMRKKRARGINILNRAILKVMNCTKLVMIGLRGTIITPFFGFSLACDFRFVSENMNYFMINIKMGIHPTGALAYFLPQYISRGKAMEILTQNREISAKEALSLGLINNIFPNKDFEKYCINIAKDYCNTNLHVITSTKRLINYSAKQIRQYMDIESSFINI